MLLNDIRILENIEILSESTSPQGLKIRGVFQRADEANNNKRIYPKAILETQVKALQPMIKENRLCGELDHPSHDIVKLTNASHLVTGLYMKGGDVIGEARILGTPAGKVAQALIEGGVKIGISSRGVGTLSEDTMQKVKFVNDDYKMVTFDLVADPSTRGAYPDLYESKQSALETRKFVDDTYKKALGEQVFVTMLKDRLGSLNEVRTSKDYNPRTPAAKQKSNTVNPDYDSVMVARGYPSVEDVMKRGSNDDPSGKWYKSMMAAVKGASTVQEGKKKKKKAKKRTKVYYEGVNSEGIKAEVARRLSKDSKDLTLENIKSEVSRRLGEWGSKEALAAKGARQKGNLAKQGLARALASTATGTTAAKELGTKGKKKISNLTKQQKK